MATLLAAHIAQHITPTILVTCWSKRQIRIDWIRTAKLLKGFIANRVIEIMQLTSDCDLRYCPTYKNQIDLQMNLSRLRAVRYGHMYRDGFVSTEAYQLPEVGSSDVIRATFFLNSRSADHVCSIDNRIIMSSRENVYKISF